MAAPGASAKAEAEGNRRGRASALRALALANPRRLNRATRVPSTGHLSESPRARLPSALDGPAAAENNGIVATVTIPLLLKEVTGGVRRAEVPGATLAEVLCALEGVFPGIEVRVASGGRLDPNLLVAVDGVLAAEGLATPVRPESEVSILPTFGGG